MLPPSATAAPSAPRALPVGALPPLAPPGTAASPQATPAPATLFALRLASAADSAAARALALPMRMIVGSADSSPRTKRPPSWYHSLATERMDGPIRCLKP